jgi:membrane protease YdiL (CAAX protease family)
MTMQLGVNTWILIGVMFFEVFFIILPALIFSKLKKKLFLDEIHEMGFYRNEKMALKLISGVIFGILLFFLSNFIIILFRDLIIRNLFGDEFVELAHQGAISSNPIQPNPIQLFILIILQLLIIGPCEEAFFRGFLVKKLKIKFKITFSILISSIIFTFYHVPPLLVPISTILTFSGYYFILGLLLSLIFVYFDYSIIPGSIAHTFFNILLILI